MHKLSVVSLAVLVAAGGILAFAVFLHPAGLPSPVQSQPASHTIGSNGIGSNSTLLTQPPTSQGSGDDGGGGSLDD
jgi:hypothetical protein